jgi:hypothetical protein
MAVSITGMMKVFYQNKLLSENFTVNVSSGDGSKSNVYDLDRDTYWITSGSNDTTEETYEVVFNNAQTISRLLLIGHNFKDFKAQYWNGSAYADFAAVYSLKTDSVAAKIDITDNIYTTRYFEFTAVSTTKIKIFPKKTMVVNAEKYLYEMYIGSEIGTFIEDVSGLPNKYIPIPGNYNSQFLKKSNGGMLKFDSSDKFSAEFTLNELWETNDQTIIQTMFSQGQFAIWPCGGVNTYTVQTGWRMIDFYSVIIDGGLSAQFAIGRDKNLGINQSFKVYEQ